MIVQLRWKVQIVASVMSANIVITIEISALRTLWERHT